MLVYHPDTETQGIIRGSDLHRFSIQLYRTFIRLFYSEQDLHERRFSGSVFPHQGVNLSSVYRKIHMRVGQNSVAVYFCDVLHA